MCRACGNTRNTTTDSAWASCTGGAPACVQFHQRPACMPCANERQQACLHAAMCAVWWVRPRPRLPGTCKRCHLRKSPARTVRRHVAVHACRLCRRPGEDSGWSAGFVQPHQPAKVPPALLLVALTKLIPARCAHCLVPCRGLWPVPRVRPGGSGGRPGLCAALRVSFACVAAAAKTMQDPRRVCLSSRSVLCGERLAQHLSRTAAHLRNNPSPDHPSLCPPPMSAIHEGTTSMSEPCQCHFVGCSSIVCGPAWRLCKPCQRSARRSFRRCKNLCKLGGQTEASNLVPWLAWQVRQGRLPGAPVPGTARPAVRRSSAGWPGQGGRGRVARTPCTSNPCMPSLQLQLPVCCALLSHLLRPKHQCKTLDDYRQRYACYRWATGGRGGAIRTRHRIATAAGNAGVQTHCRCCAACRAGMV